MFKSRYLQYNKLIYIFVFITMCAIIAKITKYYYEESMRVNSDMEKNYKYILQWTPKSIQPFTCLGESNAAFVRNKCLYTNCLVTDDRYYFPKVSQFDAIIFLGRELVDIKLPHIRSPEQRYVFAAMESPENYPICEENFDGFFNWTWTYRIDSDFRWAYVTVYDLAGHVVGPAVNMTWPTVLDPPSDELKVKLSRKTKFAAWFVSHCSTKSGRELFVQELQKELDVFGLTIDVYGPCGQLSCPRTDSTACFEMIERDYHFYLSLENALSEDYVTEKVLTALNNFAVPVVFGGANYSRFLPPGSYLDGRRLSLEELAKSMKEAIDNRTRYYDFFRWTNHYVYKATYTNSDLCKLCEMMNEKTEVSVWNDFRFWWNGDGYDHNCYGFTDLGYRNEWWLK